MDFFKRIILHDVTTHVENHVQRRAENTSATIIIVSINNSPSKRQKPRTQFDIKCAHRIDVRVASVLVVSLSFHTIPQSSCLRILRGSLAEWFIFNHLLGKYI